MTMISIGYPQTLIAGTIYALPAQACQLLGHGATTWDLSNDPAMGVVINVATTTINQATSAGFIRANTTNGNLSISPIR